MKVTDISSPPSDRLFVKSVCCVGGNEALYIGSAWNSNYTSEVKVTDISFYCTIVRLFSAKSHEISSL